MRVIGADLVPEMLAVAQRRAAGLPPEQRPVWIEDDARDARLPRRDNDFSFIAAGSFGHFTAREEQMDTLQTALRHLRPGGALAMTLGLAGRESRPEQQVGIFGPMRATPPDMSVRKVVRNQYDADAQLLTIHDQVQVQRGMSQRYFEYTFGVHLFTPAEIVRLLTRAGFVSVGMFGDYDLKPWRQGAPQWIVCAERPLV
jgi:SAM-dependent methyltransferase